MPQRYKNTCIFVRIQSKLNLKTIKKNKSLPMKKKIAVAMGGYSSEYKISLQGGDFVFQHLIREKFDFYKAHIFMDEWNIIDEINKEYKIKKEDYYIVIN